MLQTVWLGLSFIAVAWLLWWAVTNDRGTRKRIASDRKGEDSTTVFTPRDSASYIKAFGRRRPF